MFERFALIIQSPETDMVLTVDIVLINGMTTLKQDGIAKVFD